MTTAEPAGGPAAVVTGAASGIGQAITISLVDAGWRVVGFDLPGRSFDAGASVDWVGVDVSDADALERRFADAVATHGPISLLCNNAGIEGPTVPIVELALADFDCVMAINLRAAFVLTRAALAHMGANSGGAIVNVASIGGLRASDGVPAYVVSKHALVGLTRAAAREAPRAGVRVNAVCPGPIDTSMMATIEAGLDPADPSGNRRNREGRIPMRRYGRADEVAATVLWLASDAASFVNGACIVIDGGSTA